MDIPVFVSIVSNMLPKQAAVSGAVSFIVSDGDPVHDGSGSRDVKQKVDRVGTATVLHMSSSLYYLFLLQLL
jgi:hypothetical protein